METKNLAEKTEEVISRLNNIIDSSQEKINAYREQVNEISNKKIEADIKCCNGVTKSLIVYIITIIILVFSSFFTQNSGIIIGILIAGVIESIVNVKLERDRKKKRSRYEKQLDEIYDAAIENAKRAEKTIDIKFQLLTILSKLVDLSDSAPKDPFVKDHPLANLPEDTTKMVRKLEKSEE